MDKQVITVLLSLTLYVLYVLLPMIPAVVIYRLFPDNKISATGALSSLNIKTTGAFAGYIITVVLGYFLVQNTHQLIAQINNPYWTFKAKVQLQDKNGQAYQATSATKDLRETLNIIIDPKLQRINDETVFLTTPGHQNDWKTTQVRFTIPGFGYTSVNLDEQSKKGTIDGYDLSVNLIEPIVIVVDEQFSMPYTPKDTVPLTPVASGTGPALQTL